MERLGEEDGGVVIEYGIVIAVIALGMDTLGRVFIDAVAGWFASLAEPLTWMS